MKNDLRKDTANIRFADQSSLLDSLKQIDEDDAWKSCATKTIRLYPLPADDPEKTMLLAELKNHVSDLDASDYENCLASSGLYMRSDAGTYLVSIHAEDTLKDRAGVSPKKWRSATKDDKAQGLNLWMKYQDGRSSLLIRGGKVLATHSGAANGFHVLPQGKMFETATKAIATRYGSTKFVAGNYTHFSTQAKWLLSEKNDTLLAAYKKAWTASGLDPADIQDASAFLSVYTSDIGLVCASVYPGLYQRGRYYHLGAPLKMKHQKKAAIEADFNQLIDSSFALLETDIEAVAALFTIRIKYPVPAFVRAVRRLNLPLRPSREALELFEMTTENSCSAFDIYVSLAEMQSFESVKSLSAKCQLDLTENLARTIQLDWRSMDGNGPTTLEPKNRREKE